MFCTRRDALPPMRDQLFSLYSFMRHNETLACLANNSCMWLMSPTFSATAIAVSHDGVSCHFTVINNVYCFTFYFCYLVNQGAPFTWHIFVLIHKQNVNADLSCDYYHCVTFSFFFYPDLSQAWKDVDMRDCSSYPSFKRKKNLFSWRKQWQNFKENILPEHQAIYLHWYKGSYNAVLRHHFTQSEPQVTNQMCKKRASISAFVFFPWGFLFIFLFAIFFLFFVYFSFISILYRKNVERFHCP